ncbi:MAG: hypothetical protein OXG38_05760 [Chloroflexi bacterium]|nr:hypothetical protein [Chloroflexota bacterium]
MRWWKWAGGAIGVIALGAFAALWALTEADVLRWGATTALHERMEALERQAVEAPPPAPAWTVLTREGPLLRIIGQNGVLEACITYTSPAGVQERCEMLRLNNDEPTSLQRERSRCWQEARIGEPLPDCWR